MSQHISDVLAETVQRLNLPAPHMPGILAEKIAHEMLACAGGFLPALARFHREAGVELVATHLLSLLEAGMSREHLKQACSQALFLCDNQFQIIEGATS